MKIGVVAVIGIVFILNSAGIGIACTGFTASDDNKVLVGINEDNRPSRRWIEVFPPDEGKFGKIFFCYQVNGRQQGMNDQGLFWDGYSAPYLDITKGEGKIPIPDRQYFFNATLAENCSTVNDVVALLDNHDIRDFGYERGQIFFVDRFGKNFYQTHPELGGYPCWRYETAINMLENMDDFSMEYFRDICDATHQEYPTATTIYSLVCDLTHNVIHYYYHHNYEDVWEINLDELFEYGVQTYDVLDVFNNHEPSKPNRPIGPNTGSVNIEYEFSCTALDIDGDQLFYKWDWGDGNISGWFGPYDSGELCQVSHTWMSEGQYQVKAMARDTNTGKSDWSEPLSISMPKSKDIQFPLIKWFPNKFDLLFSLIEIIFESFLQ
jgi:hypothetical protein